jgi:hypothetical protein
MESLPEHHVLEPTAGACVQVRVKSCEDAWQATLIGSLNTDKAGSVSSQLSWAGLPVGMHSS